MRLFQLQSIGKIQLFSPVFPFWGFMAGALRWLCLWDFKKHQSVFCDAAFCKALVEYVVVSSLQCGGKYSLFPVSPWRDPQLRCFLVISLKFQGKISTVFYNTAFVKDFGVWLCHNVVYLYSILKIQFFSLVFLLVGSMLGVFYLVMAM